MLGSGRFFCLESIALTNGRMLHYSYTEYKEEHTAHL